MGLYLKKRKKILKKILLGAVLFIISSISFLLFSFILKYFFPVPAPVHPLSLMLLMTLITLLAYKPLDIACNHFFKNVLFKHKSYAHMALLNLAEELSVILDLQELSNLVVNTFGEVLHLKTVALLIPNRVRGDFEIASAYGWRLADSRRVRLSKDADLLRCIQAAGSHVLVRDRVIRTVPWQEATRMAHDFDSLFASWIIPLFIKEELVGAIGFSAAKPESIFDEADFQFFREFARQVAKSLRNALTVTELKVANEELQDVQSQLLQSMKLAAIEQLATGLAHEIHNPLTIISGKAQVLLLQKDRNHIDQKIEEVLKTIVKQTKRAADITRKLLMFSQSSGSPKEMLRLEQILEDTMALVSYQTSLEGIEISRKVSGMIPPIYANLHEIREVFLNLILNAVQSIGSRGKIDCELSCQPSDQVIEIRVSDTGRGIPKEHIDKLFNPFFTTRPDAVGLGLFVTKQIVHRYGGSIRVESRMEEGTLFILQFPYVDSAVSVPSIKDNTLPLFTGQGSQTFE